MEERYALCRDNELPAEMMHEVSRTYVGIAETITGEKLTVSDDPVAIPPLSKACGGPGGGAANDAEAAAVVSRWRNDGLPSALAAAGLKLRAMAAVA